MLNSKPCSPSVKVFSFDDLLPVIRVERIENPVQWLVYQKGKSKLGFVKTKLQFKTTTKCLPPEARPGLDVNVNECLLLYRVTADEMMKMKTSGLPHGDFHCLQEELTEDVTIDSKKDLFVLVLRVCLGNPLVLTGISKCPPELPLGYDSVVLTMTNGLRKFIVPQSQVYFEYAVQMARTPRDKTPSPDPSRWSVEQFYDWVCTIVSKHEADLLRKNRVDGAILHVLDCTDIERCGVPSGPAKRIEAAVKELMKNHITLKFQ